jgi:hypothetical protein
MNARVCGNSYQTRRPIFWISFCYGIAIGLGNSEGFRQRPLEQPAHALKMPNEKPTANPTEQKCLPYDGTGQTLRPRCDRGLHLDFVKRRIPMPRL